MKKLIPYIIVFFVSSFGYIILDTYFRPISAPHQLIEFEPSTPFPKIFYGEPPGTVYSGEETDQEIKYCDVCGKPLTVKVDGKMQTVIGMSFHFDQKAVDTHPEYKRVFDTFGKMDFYVCWVDWMKALGFKPLDKGGK